MIRHLSGTVLKKELGSVIVDVSGVGYCVNVSSATLGDIAPETGSPVSLWTHLAVRETSMELFGFTDRNELALFEMLIDVSGIGPRSALAILSLATVDTLRTAIGAGDITYLTKVSGIGKKTAEKIIVELRDKIGNVGATAPELKEDGDVIEVLMSLGYSREDARDVVRKVPAEAAGTSSRVKEALRLLGER